MASPAQIAANRRNARRSTGPRSAEGKAVSSRNATRHAVLSENVAASGEDAAIFENLRSGLVAEFDPQTAMETLFVERIAVLFWRERQLVNSEASMLSEASQGITRGPYIAPTLRLVDQLLVGRYQTMLTNQIASTIHQLHSVQRSRQEMQSSDNGSATSSPNAGRLPPARPRSRPSHRGNE